MEWKYKYKKKISEPKRRLTNGLTSKTSNSSICSPVPIKITGLFVAATLRNKKKFVR